MFSSRHNLRPRMQTLSLSFFFFHLYTACICAKWFLEFYGWCWGGGGKLFVQSVCTSEKATNVFTVMENENFNDLYVYDHAYMQISVNKWSLIPWENTAKRGQTMVITIKWRVVDHSWIIAGVFDVVDCVFFFFLLNGNRVHSRMSEMSTKFVNGIFFILQKNKHILIKLANTLNSQQSCHLFG